MPSDSEFQWSVHSFWQACEHAVMAGSEVLLTRTAWMMSIFERDSPKEMTTA